METLQALFKRVGKGKGKGGKPASPATPPNGGGGVGKGKGGKGFQGECWRCHEVGHRAAECPNKPKYP
eukprot:5280468-Alexandrium_andersonii.AAC.1